MDDILKRRLELLRTDYIDYYLLHALDGASWARTRDMGARDFLDAAVRDGKIINKGFSFHGARNEFKTICDEYDAGRSNANWALSWIWNHEDQIEENCSIAETALPGSLSWQELDILSRAGERFLDSLQVGCTGCQYCLPCPAGVDIPRAFAFYNAHHMFKDKLTPRGMYMLQLGGRDGGESSLAGNCIDCGKCIQHCPQNDVGKEVARLV